MEDEVRYPMHVKFLQCVSCGKTYPKRPPVFRCACGQSLRVAYDYDEIRKKVDWPLLRSREFNHWRYREFFPSEKDENIITLNEGGTPMLRSARLGEMLGLKNLFFKVEGLNPTGSFKDRGTTVEMSMALEFGAKKLACASTGNMGASVSAYAARAGIRAKIFVPRDTTAAKLRQMKFYGAGIKKINGDYTKALRMSVLQSKKNKYYLMGDYPYRGEGEKSVGFEIVDHLYGVDFIISPIGNGTLIGGIWKGLCEMREVGLLRKLPRLAGVQARGCNTVAKAFEKGYDDIIAVIPKTRASAIACGAPLDGLEALQALRASDGLSSVVSDKEMNDAKRLLAEKEGLYVELSSAATLAGLMKLKENFKKDDKIVLVLTGHGLKDS
jgi:threonine synthase